MKKYSVKRIGKVKAKKPLTKYERYIYELARKHFLTGKQILEKRNKLNTKQCKEFNIKPSKVTQASLSKVFRNIETKLQITDLFGRDKPTLIQTFTKAEPFRVHAKGFKIKIKINSNKYLNQRIIKQNKDIVDNNSITLSKNYLSILSNKDFFGETPIEAQEKSFLYWNDFIKQLERKYEIDLTKGGVEIYEWRNHIAWINSPLEKEVNQKRGDIKIHSKDGRLMFIFDKSFNLNEFEAVKSDTYIKDMSNVHESLRQYGEENVLFPLEVTSNIKDLLQENKDFNNKLNQITTNLQKCSQIDLNNQIQINNILQLVEVNSLAIKSLSNKFDQILTLSTPKSYEFEEPNFEKNYFR